MNLKTADTIRKDWGKFLEITHGSLMLIFLANIPESLLPYPKKTIEEALNIVAEHFHNQGNIQAVQAIQTTIPFLMGYVSDKEAIKKAKTNFGNKKYLEAILPHLGETQKKLLRYTINSTT